MIRKLKNIADAVYEDWPVWVALAAAAMYLLHWALARTEAMK